VGGWIAAAGKPHQHVFLILVIGTIVARSAGCVINDFADRRIDGKSSARPTGRSRPERSRRSSAAPVAALMLIALYSAHAEQADGVLAIVGAA
jgi:4-hydroxybenzoate polyprenyltransferase